MTFTYESREYRIAFQHDPSREWLAHQKHNVTLVRLRAEKAGVLLGPAILVCHDCGGLKLSHLNKTERSRNVRCQILHRREVPTVFPSVPPLWEVAIEARSKLNVKAGDRYAREPGRVAALTAALAKVEDKDFRATAWQAYLTRRERRAQAGAAELPKGGG